MKDEQEKEPKKWHVVVVSGPLHDAILEHCKEHDKVMRRWVDKRLKEALKKEVQQCR